MLKVSITSEKGDEATALAAARGILKRFAAEVNVNKKAVGALDDVLAAEAEHRGGGERAAAQVRVLAAKKAVREVTQRLTPIAAERELTDDEVAELRTAETQLAIAKRLRGRKRGDVVVDVAPGKMGMAG